MEFFDENIILEKWIWIKVEFDAAENKTDQIKKAGKEANAGSANAGMCG